MHQMTNTKELCRLCLEPKIKPNKSQSLGSTELQPKLMIVFNFELPEDESLPGEVCSGCILTVSEWYRYQETVRNNQTKLKAIVVSSEETQSDMTVKEECDRGKSNETVLGKHSNERLTHVEAVVQPEIKDETDSAESMQERIRRKRRQKVDKIIKTKEVRVLVRPELNKDKSKRIQEENQKIQEFFKMTCEFCSEIFETFDGLQRHCNKTHNAQARIKCCNRSLYKRCRIIEHIDSHLSPKQYSCSLCNKNYNTKYYLNLHNLRQHSTDTDKPFKCDQCDQSYPKEYLLKAHLNKHVQMECPICHKILASTFTLKSHMANMHSDNAKHICETCGQEFRTKLGMERHLKQHMGVNPIERLQCHVCNKWINGKPNLKVHISTVHEANQALQCDLCQQMYPNPQALNKHKRRVHVEKRFECEICGKKFKRSVYLKEHRASHTGQTLYSCSVCGMTTNSNANLYSHKKSKHPEEWMEARRKAMDLSHGKDGDKGDC